MEKLKELEATTGKTLGGGSNPLLVSVRSGAKFSMNGMMDTILNLGLNDEVVKTVRDITDNERFAMDSYRRFIQMFSDVVMEIPKSKFERVLDEIKEEKGAKFDTDLTASDLKEVVEKFKSIYRADKGEEFPQNPKDQLLLAVKAVFRSWNNEMAINIQTITYTREPGYAVNVQSMVSGIWGMMRNRRCFTRNPST